MKSSFVIKKQENDMWSFIHRSPWKDILQTLPLLLPHTKLSLGCANKIQFWLDPLGRIPNSFPPFSPAYIISPHCHKVLFRCFDHNLRIGTSIPVEILRIMKPRNSSPFWSLSKISIPPLSRTDSRLWIPSLHWPLSSFLFLLYYFFPSPCFVPPT